MLQEQMKHWKTYVEELSSLVKVILIDDGSMIHPAEHELNKETFEIPIELYRIKKDIPQNTFGARNLAFHISSVEGSKWVLSLDIDHVLPSRALEGFRQIKTHLSSENYYLPVRYIKEHSGIHPIGPHSDTFLSSPDLFWKVGGYDEDLTGYYYNGSALVFRRNLARISKAFGIDKVYTIFYPSSIISDASPLRDEEKKAFKGPHEFDKKPSVLNFEWERVL